MARSPARNRPRLAHHSLLGKLTARGDARVAPRSTLPMLAGGWRSEGFVEDVGVLAAARPVWQRGAPHSRKPPHGGDQAPAASSSARRGRWWKRAAMALLPLVSVVLGAVIWMKMPH